MTSMIRMTNRNRLTSMIRRNTQVRKKAEPSTDGCSIGKKEMRRVVPGCNATAFGGAFLGKTPLAASKNHLGLNKAVQKRTTHINHLPAGNFTDCYGHWPIYIPLLNGFAKCELTRWYMPLVSLVDTYDSSFFLDHGTLRPWQVAQWPCAERSLLRR